MEGVRHMTGERLNIVALALAAATFTPAWQESGQYATSVELCGWLVMFSLFSEEHKDSLGKYS